MTTAMILLTTPLHAAFVGPPNSLQVARATPSLQMCAQRTSDIDVESAASDLRKSLVDSFVMATERGDASAAMALCTEDFLYKTHSATTETLKAAEKRLHTKVPKPKTVSQELHEEAPGLFVREIVVKPVPFVTVGVRQEFELRCADDDDAESCELSRAEYIKLSGGKD